jgi:hypothetical protein
MSPGRLFIPRKGTSTSTDEPMDHRTNYLVIQNWANNAMQETIFTLPGSLTTDMSPIWVPQVNTTITNAVTCITQGSGVTVTLYRNGVAVAPTLSPTTSPAVVMFTPPIALKGNIDTLQAEATVVGSMAMNLTVHVRPY